MKKYCFATRHKRRKNIAIKFRVIEQCLINIFCLFMNKKNPIATMFFASVFLIACFKQVFSLKVEEKL